MLIRSLVFFACVAACAVGHAAILAAVVRRPVGGGDPGVPRPRRGLEIVWALVPAVALAIVVTATWDRVREQRSEPPVIMKVAR